MNVMKEAHKAVREAFANVGHGIKLEYRPLFRAALIDLHKKAKAMQKSPAELLKADTITKFEKRLEELKAIHNGPDALKYMVVCGDEHPMPIDFNAQDLKWPWATIETTTKWDSRQIAEAKAVKVVNGNKQVGKVVRIDHHCEWDMQNLCKLINDLQAS